MTCIVCQTAAVTELKGTTDTVVHELNRQIDRLLNLTVDAAIRGVPFPTTPGDTTHG